MQYAPDGVDGGGAKGRQPRLASTEAGPPGSVQTTLTVADRFITGSLQLRVGQLTLRVKPETVRYRGAVAVSGSIAETQGATEVDLLRPAGRRRRAHPAGHGARRA